MGVGSPAESGLTGKGEVRRRVRDDFTHHIRAPGEGAGRVIREDHGDGVPGIAMAKSATQMQGQLDQYKYSPGFKIKVLTAFAGQNPSNVLVIAATAPLDAEAGKAKKAVGVPHRGRRQRRCALCQCPGGPVGGNGGQRRLVKPRLPQLAERLCRVMGGERDEILGAHRPVAVLVGPVPQ